MRIYFIIPPATGILDRPSSPHLGVAYLAAVAREEGHEVRVVDMRFGYSKEEVIGRVKDFSTDVVCLTSTTMGYEFVYSLIDELKKHNSFVMVGGPHSSAIKKDILEESKADVAIKGEGEETLKELLINLSKKNHDFSKIRGVIWRDNGQVVENPEREFFHELDKLPFPAYDLFELERYMDKKIPIATSRGCPYYCTFCTIFLTMGRRFRARSAGNIVDELEYWENKGYRYFGFNDDNFSSDMKRAEEICDEIIKRNLKIKWELRNGVRIDRVDEPLLRKMKRAGCFYLAFGVESADQDVLNKMKKGLNIKRVKRAIMLAERVGIKKGAFFIIGLPGDNFKKFKKSLKFATSLPLDEVRFYSAVPYPGTELFSWVKENARFIRPPEEYLDSASAWDPTPVYETDDFTKEERLKALEIAESHVMRYLMKREFGNFAGNIAWYVWKPKLMRKPMMYVGKKAWTFARQIKTNGAKANGDLI